MASYLSFTVWGVDIDGLSEEDLPKLPIKVKLRLKNDSASNLGIALPPGRVRVLEPDSSGQLQKTDSTSVRGHIARNEKFVLELGNPARDIKATRELVFQHVDPVPEKKDDNFVDEGPHPIAEEGGLPELGHNFLCASFPDVKLELQAAFNFGFPHIFSLIIRDVSFEPHFAP